MIDGLLGDDGKLGPVQMRSALRLSIAAEQDAVSLYEMIARATDDPQVRKLMSDIAAE
jgi:rubrerythrin